MVVAPSKNDARACSVLDGAETIAASRTSRAQCSAPTVAQYSESRRGRTASSRRQRVGRCSDSRCVGQAVCRHRHTISRMAAGCIGPRQHTHTAHASLPTLPQRGPWFRPCDCHQIFVLVDLPADQPGSSCDTGHPNAHSGSIPRRVIAQVRHRSSTRVRYDRFRCAQRNPMIQYAHLVTPARHRK